MFEKNTAIFWFRRDLRINDNHGLYRALSENARVLPIYIFDRATLDQLPNQKDPSVTLTWRALNDLQNRLIEEGSSLWTFYGTPEEAFTQLLKETQVNAVYVNTEYEPQAIERDNHIAAFLDQHNIPFESHKDRVVFESEDLNPTPDKPLTGFTAFKRRWSAALRRGAPQPYPTEHHLEALLPFAQPQPLIPLSEMGFKDSGARLEPFNKDRITQWREQREFPAQGADLGIAAHLAYGLLSARQVLREAGSRDRVLLNLIARREYYTQLLHRFPKLSHQHANPLFERFPYRNASRDFQLWRDGKTGIPIIDAAMRQLRQTGFMPAPMRTVTASFLTRHLMIHWREGAQWFASRLIDYDQAINTGNWQRAAGTGFDPLPWDTIINPWSFARKFDADLLYIRQWVPEFLDPDYPLPIVEHRFARRRVLNAYEDTKANQPQPDPEPETPLFLG